MDATQVTLSDITSASAPANVRSPEQQGEVPGSFDVTIHCLMDATSIAAASLHGIASGGAPPAESKVTSREKTATSTTGLLQPATGRKESTIADGLKPDVGALSTTAVPVNYGYTQVDTADGTGAEPVSPCTTEPKQSETLQCVYQVERTAIAGTAAQRETSRPSKVDANAMNPKSPRSLAGSACAKPSNGAVAEVAMPEVASPAVTASPAGTQTAVPLGVFAEGCSPLKAPPANMADVAPAMRGPQKGAMRRTACGASESTPIIAINDAARTAAEAPPTPDKALISVTSTLVGSTRQTVADASQAGPLGHWINEGATNVPVAVIAHIHAAPASDAAEARSVCAARGEGLETTGHETISFAPHRLDVGVFDGTHGWMRIRAEMDPGGRVNASITPTSSAAHDSLRAALPEMANYLTSESVNVNKLAVHKISDGPQTMIAAKAESQSGGDTPRNRDGDEIARHAEIEASGASSREEDCRAATAQVSGSCADGNWSAARSVGTVGFRDWVGGLARVMPGLGLSFGHTTANCGGWVNVCA